MKSKFAEMVLQEIEDWENEHGSDKAYKWADKWYTKLEVQDMEFKRAK